LTIILYQQTKSSLQGPGRESGGTDRQLLIRAHRTLTVPYAYLSFRQQA